jgi:hypothetical protein
MGKEEATTHLNVLGDGKTVRLREPRLKMGVSSTKSLEISLFVVERRLFRNQLSEPHFDGDMDKGIAFSLKVGDAM